MASEATRETTGEILFVLDLWDVPLSGVAMFEGSYLGFQRVFDEVAQEWSKSHDFLLHSLTPIELAQFNELHDRYLAWIDAHNKGKAGPHPLTPEADDAGSVRYKELHLLVDAILHTETQRTVRCSGTITYLPDEKRYVAHWQR